MGATVSSEWLQQRIAAAGCVVLDANLTPVGAIHPSPVSSCIPGSVRFDLEAFSINPAPLPHTLLDVRQFEQKTRALGIYSGSMIVTYDKTGIYSSPRAWWNFKIMGHREVYVLDGGIIDWMEKGYPSAPQYRVVDSAGDFTATPNSRLSSSAEDVLAAIDSKDYKIIDVRSSARFRGEQEEPRPGLRKGHIPSSVNIPFNSLLNGHRLKGEQDLRRVFESVGCTEDQRMIFYCGSGVTACIGILAAFTCGYPFLSLYDGSWAEWGAGQLPISMSK